MWTYPETFDVIVVGAGHAGIEASAAAARLGCEPVLLTQTLDTIGEMACNPAIGGLAKGHMVREIDALGGMMAENCDATGIQFRMLNANKGPSVRAPRAQCDKKAYQFRMKALLEVTPRLRLMQGNVAKLLCTPDGIEGIVTNLGLAIGGKCLVVTTGTFMRGLLHVGQQNQTGGGEGGAVPNFIENFQGLGVEGGRLKKGPPFRLQPPSNGFNRRESQDGRCTPPPLCF